MNGNGRGSNGGQRATLPQHPSELTISDLANDNNENTPLLSNNKSSSDDKKNPKVDATALYVKVITEQLPWYKRPSVLWLLPIFGMTWITNGMLASSQGQFQAALLCREYLNRHTSNISTTLLTSVTSESGISSFLAAVKPAEECSLPEIQAFTAKILALTEVITGLASMFTIGYYASLSDKYGRKIIMVVGFFNALLVLGSFVLMSVYWDQIGLPLMILSGLVNGLLGGTTLGVTMALAYAADCTDPSQRSLAFSWLHAALYFGLAIGPYMGGSISKATGTILTVLFIDITVTSLGLILTVFVMPESLPSMQPEHLRQLFMPNDAMTSGSSAAGAQLAARRAPWHSHVLQAFRFFKPNGRNTNLVLLAAISFLQMLAYRGTISVIILYTNKMFNWSEYEDGVMFSLSSIARLVTMLIFLPVLVHFYQKSFTKKQRRLAAAQAAEAPGGEAHRNRNGSPYARSLSYGSQASTSNQDQDAFDRSQRSPTLHDETMIGRSDVVNNQTVFNPNDPTIAASLQFLGETALDFRSDDDDDDSDEYGRHTGESLLDRRRRQESVDSLATLTPSKTQARRSPRLNQPATTTTCTDDEPSSTDTSTLRTKEQKFSDMKFDTWMIRLGFAINSFTYIGYGLASETWMFYLATALHAASIISSPSLKALLTNLVEPSQFGAALGALQVVDSVAAVVSPVVISWVYALTVSTMPEFVWYSCAFWTGVCVVLAFLIRQKQFRANMTDA
ncbi:major facilitator superfamily domain-containing protein [Linnemannia elongata]|nr:major facilitator superfamily domain-containing protein [Linnemannia elongata]